MSKQLHEDQLRRMTAMFVENASSNETIAAAIGIANSSVSRYRRTFKGKIPMPPHVGYLLKRYDLFKLYTPYVWPEAMNVDGIDVHDDVRLAEINEANRRSGLPKWGSDEWESHAAREFEEAEAELEKIDREISDPIAAAISELEAERARLFLAIETLKRLR
jgi:hypothetical protein